jgi:CIC family chloride channel protein
MLRIITYSVLSIRICLQAAWTRSGMDSMLLWAALVGALGGLCSALFREANIGLKWLLTGQSQDIVAIAESLTPAMRLLIPALGGVAAGFALWLGGRWFKGMRSQDYLEVIRLGDGVISVKPTLTRLLSSLLSISSGSSIGREGGMVQFSALAASSVGRLFNFSRPRLRLLVACGGAAGMAAAYNTPLAGSLFIAEVVLQTLAIEALGPLIVSAVMATVVIRHWIGLSPIFTSPGFSVPEQIDLMPVLGLGLVSGVLAPAFLAFLDITRRFFQSLSLPLPLSLGLGGLIVGLISLESPEVWGNGHAVVEALLNESPTWNFVLGIFALKIIATAGAVGTGTVGGVFTPTLLIGACLGWLYSGALHVISPGLSGDSVTYAALGMGAFLSATSLAPLMATLMIFEMTLDANILFPLILAAVSARYMAAAIRPVSVYARALGEIRTQLPYLMHVSDLLTEPAAVIKTTDTAEKVSGLFCRSSTQHVWVIDDQGTYQGSIALNHMKLFLGDPSLQHLSASIVFMEDDLPTMTPDTALTEALGALVKHEADRLPIVGPDRKLLGEITKSDALLALG